MIPDGLSEAKLMFAVVREVERIAGVPPDSARALPGRGWIIDVGQWSTSLRSSS